MANKFATPNEVCKRTVCVHAASALELLKKAGSYSTILKDEKLSALFDTLVPGAGTVVGSFKEGTFQVLETDSHDVIVASSGRKKTRAEILPSVISYALAGLPIIVNDMKGEVLDAIKPVLDAMEYKTYVLDFRNPASSPNCFNPLSLAWDCYAKKSPDEAAKVIRNIAEVLYSDLSKNTNDYFWPSMAIEYFSGLALGMLELRTAKQVKDFTIEGVYNFSKKGVNPLRELFLNIEGSVAEHNVHGILWAPSDTRSSIESVFSDPLSIFCSQKGLMNLLSHSDFSPSDLTQSHTALFVISPDENSTMAPIVTAVFSQLMSELVSIATRAGGALPYSVQFVLDEFGNLCRIPNFEHIVSAARSRGLRLHICLQSTYQLSLVYGNDVKNIITGNIYNWIYMGTRDLAFLKEFSEQLGTYTTSTGNTEPILNIQNLTMLEKRECETEAICLIEDLKPYLAVLPDYEYLYEPFFTGSSKKEPTDTQPHEKKPTDSTKKKKAGDTQEVSKHEEEQPQVPTNGHPMSDMKKQELLKDVLSDLETLYTKAAAMTQNNQHD